MIDEALTQALAATHAAAFQTDRPWSADEFAELLKGPGVWLTGDPDSFVLGRIALDEAEILTLATTPSLQRQGKAREMLAEFEQSAADKGAKTAFLEVAQDNNAACALYAAAGYATGGKRLKYYARQDGSRVDALILRKDLTLG